MASSCSSPTYTYDNADRLTTSPAGLGYSYDAHGNLTQYTTSGGQTILFAYDANDQAKTITTKTGSTTNQTVNETISSTGRVLRRNVTGTNAEDTDFGFAGEGDSPAYAKPHAGGTVTTYLGDAMAVGSTLTYFTSNQHGDITGTVTSAGVFTAAPVTDEFGVTTGTIPSSRLGWLGTQERFTVAQGTGIVRMGARLYDPATGRFTQRDPILGGSANDYDYVSGDPINATDLAGLCNSGKLWCVIRILRGQARLPTIVIRGQTLTQFLRARGGHVVSGNTKAGFRRMKSNGSCSAPRSSAFNFDFNNACKTHDLGYDLMRFFRTSGPLGSTRVAVDALFLWDMKSDCRGRGWWIFSYEASCRAVASAFYAGVTANSVWQRYGVP